MPDTVPWHQLIPSAPLELYQERYESKVIKKQHEGKVWHLSDLHIFHFHVCLLSINNTTAKLSYISDMQAAYPEGPQGMFSSLELIRMGKPAHSYIITRNSWQSSCGHWNSWFLNCLKSRRSCDYSVSVHNLNTQLSTQAKKVFSSVASECAVKLKDWIP